MQPVWTSEMKPTARRSVALVLCLSVLLAGVLFSSLRVIGLSERVRRLEQAQAVPTTTYTQKAVPFNERRQAPPDGSQHKVLSVIDGDTVKIDSAAGPLSVRIIGVDTPETVHPARPVEPFGPEASEHARELLLDRRVTIHYDPDPTHDRWGKYGRLLAYIDLPDGRDFGLVMISEGLARAYPKYPFSRMSEYLRAENEAKTAKVGMWGVAEPQGTQ